MTFIPTAEVVADAVKSDYAVPAFNTNGGGYDLARAALEAAQEMRSPLILQVYEPNCAYRGYRYFVELSRFLMDDLNITVPVALHLDHGKSMESVTAAMDAGFTGVMFDASAEPLERNIAETRLVLAMARQRGVSLEAEIGYVTGNEKKSRPPVGRYELPLRPATQPGKTTVEEARQFVEAVDVDLLAVATGATHGVYQEQTGADVALVEAITRAVPTPLVLHGTCGISKDALSQLAAAGIRKANFGEPFRADFIRHFVELSDSMAHEWHAWRIMEQVKERIKQDMIALINALGSANRA